MIKLLIGVQDDAKTKAKTLKAYSATEVDLNPDFNRVQSEAFTDSAYREKGYVSERKASGSFTLEVTPETLKDLLPAFGYTLSDVPGTPPSENITFEGIKKITHKGTANEGGKINKFFTIVEQDLEFQEENIITGAQFNSVELNFSKGSYVTMKVDVIGYKFEYKNSKSETGENVSDIDNVITCNGIHLSLDDEDISANAQSIVVTISNNLEARFGLGSPDATEIRRTNFIEAKANLTFVGYEKEKYELAYERLINGDVGSAEIKLLGTGETAFGVQLHKIGVSSVQKTDKKSGAGMTQELEIFNDREEKTPITFVFGTADNETDPEEEEGE